MSSFEERVPAERGRAKPRVRRGAGGVLPKGHPCTCIFLKARRPTNYVFWQRAMHRNVRVLPTCLWAAPPPGLAYGAGRARAAENGQGTSSSQAARPSLQGQAKVNLFLAKNGHGSVQQRVPTFWRKMPHA